MAKIAPKGKKVTGTKKKDKITWTSSKPWKTNLTVKAGSGNDVINFKKSKYKNKLYGDAGNDKILGGKNIDKIFGGAGNDKMFGYNGNDIIKAGAGNDSADGGAGNDKIYGESGTNNLKGGAGNDQIWAGTGTDNIWGGAGNDIIDLAKGGKNTVYGEAGADKILNIKGNSVVDGGADNDTITAVSGNNTLKGGAGNDQITGGSGNDEIYGGIGNDTISAGAGNNTICFNKNDGTDTIVKGTGTDTLVFSNVADFRDLNFEYSGNDLNVSAAGTTVKLKDYKNGGHSAKYLKVGNQTFSIPANFITGNDATVNGTAENDVITATGTEYAQHVYAGGGNDVIYASDNATYNYIYAEEGNNVIYSSSNANSSHSADYIYGGTGNDTIYGADGVKLDIDLKLGGNNTVYLGTRNVDGNDICLGAGNDTIYLSPDGTGSSNAVILRVTSDTVKNGGHDVVYARSAGETYDQHEMIDFATDYDDLIFTKNNNDLVVIYNDNNDVTFKDYFMVGNEYLATTFYLGANNLGYWKNFNSVIEDKGGIKTLVSGVNGTTGDDYIIGTDNSETIVADAGNDVINPKGGDDTIWLYLGNNVVLAGEGNKLIEGSASAGSIINLGSGNNRVILGSGADKVNSGSGSNTIELYSSADQGDDIYSYGGGNDTLHFKHDILNGLSVDLRGDDIVLTRGMNGAAEFRKTVTIKNLYDLTNVTVKDEYDNTSLLFNLNTVTGDSSKTTGQTITTGSGYDEIYLGKGNDIVDAGGGENIIYLTLADNNNVNTYTYNGGATIDTFILPEEITSFDGITMQKSGNDLIVGFNGSISDNTVIIKNYYDDETINSAISFTCYNAGEPANLSLADLIASKGVTLPSVGTEGDDNPLGDSGAASKQYILGLGGNDKIYGGSNNDYIDGGAGNDSMYGGSGDDIYEISADDWGNDKDTILDTAGNDTLKINTQDTPYLFFDVALKYEDSHIVMNGNNAAYTLSGNLYLNKDNEFTYANANNYQGVVIENYFESGNAIENIQKLNGSNWIEAFDSRLINVTAQAVANWLKSTNYFKSVSDALAVGNDAQREELLSLFKPIYTDDYQRFGTENADIIFGTKDENVQYLHGDAGDDVIFASSNGVGYNYIYGGEGNDIIYSTSNTDTTDYIYAGTDDDTIYGADGVSLSITLSEGGNNTVYLGKRHLWDGNTITMAAGNDTIYMSPDATNNNGNAGIFYINYNNNPVGDHDTFYWGGAEFKGYQHEMICFGVNDEELYFTRETGSDDLVIRYGGDSDVTFVDYFKDGNMDFGRGLCYDTANSSWANFDSRYFDGEEWVGENLVADRLITPIVGTGTINGTSGNDYIKGNFDSEHTPLTLDGGAGDDIYCVAGNDGIITINDSSGDDKLYLAGSKEHTIIMPFNIKNDGTFADGDETLELLSDSYIEINGFDSIEKIITNDFYYIDKDHLTAIKNDVVGWLTTANGGLGYDDVNTAIDANDADIATLRAIFTRDSNWQTSLGE